MADVTAAHPVTGISSGTLRGKLDSGTDVTVIPARLVAFFNITPRGHIWTRSYDGTYARRLVYYVRLTVEGFTLPSVRCIATDRTNILLGRNVLNRFIVTLDGKSLTFALQDP